MAIFNKDATTTERTEGKAAAPQGEAALSIIAAGMKITGDVDTTGVIKIEGSLQGTVRNARQVLLGRQGEVKGDINAKEVVLGGRVDGNVRGFDRVEVQGTSTINGDIQTKSIAIAEGAKLNGAVRMDDGVAVPRSGDPINKPLAVAR